MTLILNISFFIFIGVCISLAYSGCKKDMETTAPLQQIRNDSRKVEEKREKKKDFVEAKVEHDTENPPTYSEVFKS